MIRAEGSGRPQSATKVRAHPCPLPELSGRALSSPRLQFLTRQNTQDIGPSKFLIPSRKFNVSTYPAFTPSRPRDPHSLPRSPGSSWVGLRAGKQRVQRKLLVDPAHFPLPIHLLFFPSIHRPHSFSLLGDFSASGFLPAFWKAPRTGLMAEMACGRLVRHTLQVLTLVLS